MSYVVTRIVKSNGPHTTRELTTVAPTAEEAVCMFRAMELAQAYDQVADVLGEIANEGEQ